MAVAWTTVRDGVRYEVRTAGNTRRLYADGVCHSQFNPGRPVTGRVWDLLMLPSFFYPPGEIARVLVLGVGGGTVIRQLRIFRAPETIVAVDLNPVHLHVARRYFGLGAADARLHEADAVRWLERYRGPRFDMIVDDLFGEAEGEPVRAVRVTTRWAARLARHLTPDGLIVVNFVSGAELRESALVASPRTARRFASAFALTTPTEENVVGAFLRRPATSAELRRRLATVPALDPRRRTSRLRYRIRKLY